MTLNRLGLDLVAVLFWASVCGATEANVSGMGPLVVHPANPRYFQNAATGRAVLLTGSHTWANLVDMGTSDPPAAFDFDAYLDWMAGFNHNFIRLWAWELVTWDTSANSQNKRHTIAPLPYARTGSGAALDGKPKFDLTKFNPEYFDRLRQRVASAREHGIYVSVMLFEGWALQFASGAWDGHPFHPSNNINGINGDANGDGKGIEIHELGNQAVTAIQEAYVRKVIDTVNGFDNVLYEVSNENHPPSTEWQYHIIRLIQAYEQSKPQQHPVGMTFQYRGGKNQALFDSPADWISPNPEGGYRDDPPVADGRKIIINDTDHLWGIGGNQSWVWKSLLRGCNPIFMDPYDDQVLAGRPEAKWDPIRKSMGYALAYAGKMDLSRAVPTTDVASTTYCLANPGQQYLVYRPAGQGDSFTVKLAPASYTYEWFDPAPGGRAGTGTANAATDATEFRAPFAGDAVLWLNRKVFPTKDWIEATPSSQGVNEAALKAAVDYLRANAGGDGVNQALIVRNGYVIWRGPDVDKVHGIWSCTKSFTSTVLGLLIDDGKATLDTLARDYVPAMTSAYPNVTLRHLATMTSGYRAVGDEPHGSYRHGPSPTPFDPCDTPLFAPGAQYAYWDSAMNQFANVLTRIAGEPLEALFRRRIAEPIGMDPKEWRWGHFGPVEGMVVNGGSGNLNRHVFISARQMARLGLLFLNEGNWDGRQLVDAAWVRAATRPQVSTTLPVWRDSGADGCGVYGFNWWTNGTRPDGSRKWPGVPAGAFSASGYNNNDMFVIPEWNMVIVRLGLDENQVRLTDAIYSQFLRRVGDALLYLESH
ncbi:MAG: serine hydrolase [Sedimentisphaerales bacterium]|nr:serine hydrolase [Sedimentisphaerales bacterium]